MNADTKSSNLANVNTAGRVAMNPRGMALDRRKGFVTEATLRVEMCVRGECFDLLYMGLQL